MAVAATATILLVVQTPTLRAFAHRCGVFVARVAGFSQSRPVIADLVVRGMDGQSTRLSASRGSVVLLTIWPPTCARCDAERSWFEEFQREYGARGLAVATASFAHDGPAIGVSGPTTVILDRTGGIAVTHAGFCSKAEYRRDIEKLLAE
jgi:thiol-disulfide isomerase/thioredoxin